MAKAKKSRKIVDVKKVAKTWYQIDAGKARAEGMRLYKVAGRPSQADVVTVFGTKKAIAWTWAHRAKVMELATAEDAALAFQKALAAVAQLKKPKAMAAAARKTTVQRMIKDLGPIKYTGPVAG
jgi:hypothetical protein